MKGNASQPRPAPAVLFWIGLTLLAFAVRFPYLNQVPCWSAGNENNLALAILNGARPLTNQNPHLGALSPYLVALALRIFGFHSVVPRLVPFLAGIATVLLTWRLGRRTGSERAGIIAAGWMAAAWYHAIFSSHYPWSNSLTPFFATAFLLVLTHFQRDTGIRRGVLQAGLAGLLFGLGMQTHPEMVTLLPVAVVVLIRMTGRPLAWLRRPAPYVMAAAGALGYGNMLYYNLVNRFKSVSFGLTYPEYALTKEYTATSVGGNYLHEFLYLPRIIFGFFSDELPWRQYALHPMIWLFWILVIAGIVMTIRDRRPVIPVAFMSSFLIIPALNSNYSLYLGRYLVFMFPPALILAAESLDRLLRLRIRRPGPVVIRAGALAVFALMFVVPLVQIRAFYAACESSGLTRERFHRLDHMIRDTGLNSPLIILDQETGAGDD
ncbi:MAG TPA: glycosyltransferase family 39 protein, partial [bacterium]|nr:glycosyltransferase family 39 protein [bacterium]